MQGGPCVTAAAGAIGLVAVVTAVGSSPAKLVQLPVLGPGNAWNAGHGAPDIDARVLWGKQPAALRAPTVHTRSMHTVPAPVRRGAEADARLGLA